MEIGFRRSVYAQELPAGNYIVMMLATVTFAIQMIGDPKQQYLNGFILKQFTFSSMFFVSVIFYLLTLLYYDFTLSFN